MKIVLYFILIDQYILFAIAIKLKIEIVQHFLFPKIREKLQKQKEILLYDKTPEVWSG